MGANSQSGNPLGGGQRSAQLPPWSAGSATVHLGPYTRSLPLAAAKLDAVREDDAAGNSEVRRGGGLSHRGGACRPDEMGQHVIVAKLSHGGVALYESSTNRLSRWLLVSSGTATAARLNGDEVTVAFADGQQGIFDRDTGDLKRMGVATQATAADR